MQILLHVLKKKVKKKDKFDGWKSSGSEEEEEEEDDDEFFEDDESLKFSSPSETELELESDGSEYTPQGRNAKRQQELIRK